MPFGSLPECYQHFNFLETDLDLEKLLSAIHEQEKDSLVNQKCIHFYADDIETLYGFFFLFFFFLFFKQTQV